MVLSTTDAQRLALDGFVAEERLAAKPARPSVYLDTTIPSYFTAPMSADFAKRRMQRLTRIWWSRYRPKCDVFVSDCVFDESRGGSEDAVRKRLSALQSPEKARIDAEHIAYAATNSVRFLLTWNCKHVANRMIFHRVAQRCESHGFRFPQICTPETMMRIYAYERYPY
jgi:hypothetical protein